MIQSTAAETTIMETSATPEKTVLSTGFTQEETTIMTATGVTTIGQTTMETCEHMEYIDTLIDNNAVTTIQQDVPNKKDFISKGVDFVEEKPIIVINIPSSNGASVRDIKVPSDNVNEIVVTFTTISGINTTPIRGNPTDLPRNEFPKENVVTITIELTSTSDNSSPKGVTLSVVACAPGKTTVVTEGKEYYSLFIFLP